jgi:DNA-binding NtrC family response regulator
VLASHSWPGNIRELRNIVTKAAVLSETGVIEPQDLSLNTHTAVVGMARASHPHTPPASLDGMERRMIFEALEATGGHQKNAAARLGISRRTLSRKLKLYETEKTRVAV